MHPDVSVGAEIVGLPLVVEIHDTEESALKAVAPAGSGSQTHPPAVRNATHAAFEGHRRQVVALVYDDKPVALEHIGDVLTAGQRLKGDEVYYAAAPRSPGAELADVPLL